MFLCSVSDGGNFSREWGYIVWDRVRPVAFCGAPYVDMFAASQETMKIGMPYDGPEVAAADRSVH